MVEYIDEAAKKLMQYHPVDGMHGAKDGICFNCRDKLFLLRLIRKTGKKLMEQKEDERHAAYIGWCKKLWRDDR